MSKATKDDEAQVVKLPPVKEADVVNALADVNGPAMLADLVIAHGALAVATAVARAADDPNYGATARAWLKANT